MFRKIRAQGPWAVLSAVVLGLLITSFAGAAVTGRSILGGVRNPTNGSTFSSETQIIANNGTYGTRQSNLSDHGGGAIYGCRSTAGGSPKGKNPCIRANNLSDGRAFEFESRGAEVGAITSSNSNAAPFTTNAHGVATGLNADQVDGKGADDIKADTLKDAHTDALATAQGLTHIAAVAADGTLGAVKRGAASAARTATGEYTVAFSAEISACAIQATETTATDPGAVGVELGTDKKTVTVRTNDPSGAAADRPFNLTVSC